MRNHIHSAIVAVSPDWARHVVMLGEDVRLRAEQKTVLTRAVQNLTQYSILKAPNLMSDASTKVFIVLKQRAGEIELQWKQVGRLDFGPMNQMDRESAFLSSMLDDGGFAHCRVRRQIHGLEVTLILTDCLSLVANVDRKLPETPAISANVC